MDNGAIAIRHMLATLYINLPYRGKEESNFNVITLFLFHLN